MRHAVVLLAMCVVPVHITARLASAQADNLPSTPESVALVDRLNDFEADRRALSSFYPMSFDGPSLDRLERLYRESQAGLGSIDFGALDQQGRIDYLLFRTHLEAQLDELALSRRRLDDMRPLVPFADTVAALERERVAMRSLDYAAVASLLDGLEAEVKSLRERIEQGRKNRDGEPAEPAGDTAALGVSPVLANRAAGLVWEVRRTLDHWYEYRDGFEPEFGWWVKAPREKASAALEEYAKYLAETVAGVKGEDDDPMIGDPIGPEKLLGDLRAEWIPYAPEELIEIAEKEFAYCEGEMRAAAEEMGLGGDWKAALGRVKESYVDPGEQDDLVAFLAQEAIDYVTENHLVTIPPLCEELWRLEMIPARNQRYWPFAFYGGNHMGVAYPTSDMSHEDKLMSMRGNNRHFTRAVVHHELIPGHHLQGFMAQRERPYRRMFSTPFLGEGWCLYWELLLYDRGFPQTPEDRIGMLFWRMHRCARIIVSLRFHLGEMAPQEMVDFLVERVGHERFGAASEVRRYIGGQYSPLYQCAYMVGGLQLRALAAEVRAAGRATAQEFHDAVLLQGPIPVELIRAALIETPLTAESESGWRFAEPGGP
ncbi:MAG TPA: DUF885 domain-containing protein [Phycisphaerales bacterium]|nr:DUF885 domain-containing protein [Phycisphaerales bacterium]